MDPINQIKSRMRSNFGWCDISPPLPPLYLFLSQNSIWAVNDCIFLDNFVCVCVCDVDVGSLTLELLFLPQVKPW